LKDGAGNILGQTNYSYDSTPLTTVSPTVVNNDSTVGAARGNLTQVSRWVGGTSFLNTTLTYDTTGQVVQIKDPLGNLTKIDYTDNFFKDDGTNPPPNANPTQATNAYPTTVTPPASGNVQFGYYFGTGKQALAIDENGQKAYQHFADSLDRPTQVVSPKGWQAMSYQSLLTSDLFTGLADTVPSTNCTGCTHEQNTVDVFGRLVQSALMSDPDGAVSREISYDTAGNLLTATNPHRSPTTLTTSNSYDAFYRPTRTVHPDGSVAQLFYGSGVANQPNDQGRNGNTNQLCAPATYGIVFPILAVNEVGQRQETWIDAFGRTIESDEADDNGALSVATCYQYNLGGELTQVVQGGLTRSYQYDPLWRATQATTPEAGTVTYSFFNDDGTLCSGISSNVCKRVDARGIKTSYKYDAAGRLTQKSYSDGTPTAFFNYDESSSSTLGASQLTNTIGRPSSTYTKDGTGKLIVGEVFSYDSVGNLINNSQCTPQNCGTNLFQNTYVPDQVGNIVTFSNNWGRNLSAVYGNAGQPTSLTVSPSDATHPATIFSNAKYDQFGNMTSAKLGNGLFQVADYSNGSGWLNALRVGAAPAVSQTGGNAATPGSATITVSGSDQQVATRATPGVTTVAITGADRQLSTSTQPAAPSTGTMTINGFEQVTQAVEIPAAPGSGAVAITGALQSKQTTVPGTTSAGVFAISGTLQIIQGSEATSGAGSVTLSGSEQSKPGSPAVQAMGRVTIAGTESSTTIDPCADQAPTPNNPNPSCPRTISDTGTVSITVNGFTKSVSYSAGSDSPSLASGLTTAFNSDSASPVTASANSSIVSLTSKSGGTSFNYSLSAASSTNDAADFGTASFTASPSGATLTGGANSGPSIFDSGTCSVALNGTVYSTAFGQGDTSSTISSRLAAMISGGTLANATTSSAAMSLTAKQTGSASNYPLSSNCSYNSSAFSSPSFLASPAGPALSGGTNPGPTYADSGTVTVTIGSFVASIPYQPSDPNGNITVASNLAAKLNSQSGSPVTATTSGSTLNLTYRTTGKAGNISFACTSATGQPDKFSGPSFTCPATTALNGGKDAVTNTTYDSGTVGLTVGSYTARTSYSQSGNTTAAQIASALVSDPNTRLNVANSPVTATVAGATISLLSKAAGARTNYSLSVSSGYDSSDFTSPSFTGTLSGPALTGGLDQTSTPIYDSGTFSVTINNHIDVVDWGKGTTAASIAAALTSKINRDAGASVTASASGNVVTFTSKTTGAGTNYAYVPQVVYDAADFSQPSFTFQPNVTPPATLLGGRDANGATWDTGAITITINGFSKTVRYSQTQPAPDFPSAFISAFNNDPNSPVWARVATGQELGNLTFTAKKSGANSNYPISATSASDNPNFTGTSFPISLNGPTLTGGGSGLVNTFNAGDTGIVSLSVGSYTASVLYNPNLGASGPGTPPPVKTPATLLVCCGGADVALALGNVINQSSSSPVTAAVSGPQITLIAKSVGSASNLAFSTTSQPGDPVLFPSPSFTFTGASGSLTGGAGPSNPNAPSSSTAVIAFSGGGNWSPPANCAAYHQVTVNGRPYKTCLTSSPLDPVALATTVAQTINSAGGPVTALALGDTVYLQSASAGAATNYIINSNVIASDVCCPLPITTAISGPTMVGGSGSVADGSVYSLDVGTDPSGTVFQVSDSVNGNWTYLYDNLNRLQQASTPSAGYQYDYDRYGNRLHQTPLNGGNGLSLVYVNNQISALGIVYDASGNMIQDGNHTYSYDAENRLVSVDGGQTATYLYSADGLRVRSTVGANFVDYVHDGAGEVVGVLGANGALIRQEIGGLATYNSNGAYFHHRDGLGNLRVITDQTGTITQTCTNLPFGDALNCTASGITPLNFTSYTRDAETQLDFADARYYTSQFGRFMSPDPLGGKVAEPQSLNRYAYVTNDPLSLVDPSGLDPFCPPWSPLCYAASGGNGGNGGNGGGVVVIGGPFGGGGGAFGFGGGGLSICFALNCGFGGGGFASTLPGPPSAGQIASESTSWDIAAGIGKELSNAVGSFLEGYAPSFLVQNFIPTQKASNSAQTWAMRGTFAATLFIPGAGEEEALAVGESKLAGRMTDLYLRFSKTGAYQKVGVSVNAASRYPIAKLGGDIIVPVTRVVREQALAFERFIYKRAPGPLNGEHGAGSLFSKEAVHEVDELLKRIWR
jgi:RHS repeat-associated protein